MFFAIPINPRKNARLRNAAHRILPGILRKQRYAVRLRAKGQKNNQQKTKTMRKYKLTDETITIVRNGKEITLHRIEALRDLAIAKTGDKGGYVESEANLSHEGTC